MQKTKICTKCKKGKPLSGFYKSKRYKSGYLSHCKKCHGENLKCWRKNNPQKRRDIANKHNKKVKQKCINYKGGKCQVCGYDKCIAALDFHHINSEKKDFGVGNKGRSWKKMKVELNKCILICANCHRELHYRQSK